MTPQAKLRMDVYQEGQRAFNSGVACPYTDWRAKTWSKGRHAAEQHYAEMVRPVPSPEQPPTPAEQWSDICERSAGYLQDGRKGLMIDEEDLVLIGTLLGA